MAHTTKPKRAYNASRRQAQAAETRRLIVEAAQKLFTARGYAGTTIQAVADEAGVSSETIYAVFGSKRAILTRWLEIAVGGDERPLSVLDREQPQSVRRDQDQRSQIRSFAMGIRAIMERVSPVFDVMRVAAKTEPDIATLLQRTLDERLSNLGQFVGWLAENGPLRSGLDSGTAAESIWALTSAEMHRLLTVDRGWSGDRYEQWLSDILEQYLLPAPRQGRSGSPAPSRKRAL